MALALIVAAWAKANGRRLLLLTIDHGLRPESVQWTAKCQRLAQRLGVNFQALTWEGRKPLRGLPAAARAARHGLLADAAREAGARVVLLGHTADDLVEAARMRAAGSSIPDPREWAPSPAWPEGRGVFLLRPLLRAGREEIRAWLRVRGETWIEDPSNEDLRFARARARAAPEGHGEPRPYPSAALSDLVQAVRTDAAGALMVPRAQLRHPAARAFVAMASVCAAGSDRLPRADRADRLLERLTGEAPVTMTLSGARIEADATTARFMRDAGESERTGLAEIRFGPGVVVWDGRFEIHADRPILVRGVDGLRGRLPREARTALAAFPPKVREGLPVTVERDGGVSLLLDPAPGVRARPLAYERLLAACGAVPREP